MKFIKKKISELSIELIDGDRGKNYPKKNEFLNKGDCVFLNAKNVTSNDFCFEEINFITKDKDKLLNNGKLKRKDIVLTTRGTVGNVAYYSEKIPFECMRINSGMIIIRCQNSINEKYIYWYMRTKQFKNQIKELQTGSAQPQLPLSIIKNMVINICDMKNQNKIVYILDKIQEKINLNTHINNNLYEIMKRFFDNWVNNLDNYEESSLSKIANYINGLAMQKYRAKNEIGLPVIKIKEMNEGITDNTERCSSNIKEDYIIENGDILFAWSGTLCMTIWAQGKAGLNQHIFKVQSKKYPKWFYYLWTEYYLGKFVEIAAGKATTMGHIKRKELDTAKVKIPIKKEMDKMDRIMQPMLDKYINNKINNETLKQVRDTLLPKLMNGEIDLDKIEI